MLDSWCGGSTLGVASVAALADALHNAGMDFHANTIRAVNHEYNSTNVNCGFGQCVAYWRITDLDAAVKGQMQLAHSQQTSPPQVCPPRCGARPAGAVRPAR